MANYSTDTDLVQIRPKVLEYGVDDWTGMHTRAKAIIDSLLEQRWYRDEAEDRGVLWEDAPFDSDRLRSAQILYLSCYKTLELIYEYLMKDGPEADGFARQMALYNGKFDEELQRLLSLGLDYDWDDDDTIEESERISTKRRRLRRT